MPRGNLGKQRGKTAVGGDSAGGEEGRVGVVLPAKAREGASGAAREAPHDALLKGEGERGGVDRSGGGVVYFAGEGGFESRKGEIKVRAVTVAVAAPREGIGQEREGVPALLRIFGLEGRGVFFQGGSAGPSESEEAGGLVQGFAGGVVQGLSVAAEFVVRGDGEGLAVSARGEQQQVRELQFGPREPRREGVRGEVIDGEEGRLPGEGEGARGGGACDESADESGPARGGDGAGLRLSAEGLSEERRQVREVLSGGDFGHDSAEAPVLCLRSDVLREDVVLRRGLEERGRGFVAGAFYGEDEHVEIVGAPAFFV